MLKFTGAGCAGACSKLVAAQANSTAADDQDTVEWMVANARNAAGLGIGVVAAGIVLIVALSALGNVGLPKDECRDDVYAPPAVEVEVRANRKGRQKVSGLLVSCHSAFKGVHDTVATAAQHWLNRFYSCTSCLV